MSKTSLVLFWIIWLIDVLILLFGHQEFLQLVFGRNSSPGIKTIGIWVFLIVLMLLIICGSLYLKNHAKATMAIMVSSIPLVIALPYFLWLGVVLFSGKSTNWH